MSMTQTYMPKKKSERVKSLERNFRLDTVDGSKKEFMTLEKSTVQESYKHFAAAELMIRVRNPHRELQKKTPLQLQKIHKASKLY